MSTRKTAKLNPISKWLAAADTNKLRSALKLLAISVALTAAQLCIPLINAPALKPEQPYAYSGLQETLPSGWTWKTGRYWRLLNWDSYHYYEIMQRGYHAQLPLQSDDVPHFRTTGPFLPGYPLLAKVLQKTLPVAPETAMLIAAQSAALVFWLFLLLWFRLMRLTTSWQALLTMLIWSFPSSFFLVAGYSESTYCAGLMAIGYWMERLRRTQNPAPTLLSWAAISSLFFGITRIFSAPVLIYPFARALWNREGHQMRYLGLIAIPGLLALYTWTRYLDYKLGIPNAFYELQRVAYGHQIQPFAFLDPSIYVPRFFKEVFAVSFNRIMAAFCWLGLAVSVVTDQHAKRRVPLYALIFGLHWIGIATKAHSQLDGIARYALPVFVLLMMASAERIVERPRRPSLWWWLPSVLLACIFLGLQVWTGLRFTLGRWIT